MERNGERERERVRVGKICTKNIGFGKLNAVMNVNIYFVIWGKMKARVNHVTGIK